jgi:DNA repair protein RecO (recombination protein O)
MTETVVYLQPAFILQYRKYRETSLIMDVLTRDYGRVSVLAKGVRKSKSKTAGLLQPFRSLVISYLGKTELKVLTHVEIFPSGIELKGMACYSGFYLNELIAFFLHKDDPHPEVFNHYLECLIDLSSHSVTEAALRTFELNLLGNAGYGLQFDHDYQNNRQVEPFKNYLFDVEKGPIEAENGQYSGATLRAISSRDFSDPQVCIDAKRLMRAVIDVNLQGKPLKSRAIIHKIFKQTRNA